MSGDDDDNEPTCPCGVERPNTLMLECTDCETYYHTVCCGLSGLTQMPINKLINNNWRCPKCFVFPETIQTAVAKTKLDEDTVTSIVTLVHSKVMESMKTLISQENIRNHSEESDSDDTESTDEAQEQTPGEGTFQPTRAQAKRNRRKRANANIQKAIQEQREEEILIDKKKDNLVVYGMPESDTEDKKAEMLEDYRKIKKAYDGKVNVEKEDITHLTRLGKKGTNPRPIQFTLASQDKRKELLTKNMNLKLMENNESIQIYVSTDRTKKQREEYKTLRAELKERKKTNPNLCIRNNKIVPFRDAAQETKTWAEIAAE